MNKNKQQDLLESLKKPAETKPQVKYLTQTDCSLCKKALTNHKCTTSWCVNYMK